MSTNISINCGGNIFNETLQYSGLLKFDTKCNAIINNTILRSLDSINSDIYLKKMNGKRLLWSRQGQQT